MVEMSREKEKGKMKHYYNYREGLRDGNREREGERSRER